jgi:hypothetical protein
VTAATRKRLHTHIQEVKRQEHESVTIQRLWSKDAIKEALDVRGWRRLMSEPISEPSDGFLFLLSHSHTRFMAWLSRACVLEDLDASSQVHNVKRLPICN